MDIKICKGKNSRCVKIFSLIITIALLVCCVEEKQSSEGYKWIWEEDYSLGSVPGDDVLFWGENLGPYHNYEETLDKIFAMEVAFPELVDIFSIGETTLGKTIYVVKITDESFNQEKCKMLVAGPVHAREVICVEATLHFMDMLLYNYVNGLEDVSSLLAEREVYIIPIINIDGLDVIHLNPWQRKNLAPIDDDDDGTRDDEWEISDADGDGYIHATWDESSRDYDYYEGIDGPDDDETTGEDMPGGVDLNRNADYRWSLHSGSSDDPHSEIYAGESPASEPETQAFQDFVRQHHFYCALCLHSGIQVLFPPGVGRDMPSADYLLLKEWASRMNKEYNFYTDPTTPDEFYTIDRGRYYSGQMVSWLYANRGMFSYTFEIYGNHSALETKYISSTRYEEKGIWDFFNPPPCDVLDLLSQKITPALMDFMKMDPIILAIEPSEETSIWFPDTDSE